MPRINPHSPQGLVWLILAATLGGALLPANAEDALPSSFAKDRYTALRERSPFALATVAAPVVSQATFAANWYVTGVARVDDNYYVTIKGRDLATQLMLFGHESVDGVSVASVNWSDQVGKSTVILRKGTETARLEFSEAQLRASGTPTAGVSPSPGAKPGGAAAATAAHPAGVSVAAVANPPGAGINGGIALKRRSVPIPVPR